MASAAKRAAAVEAAAVAPDASAARTWPISVHLTPFAPDCAREPIQSRRRWATFYGKTPNQVVRSTLARCRLAPGAVRTAVELNGDVQILADVPPELLRLISTDPGEPVPFAIFWDGLTEAQLRAELADLTTRGWKPAQLTEGAH